MLTIGIAIPTPEQIDPEFSLISLPQLIAYTKKQRPDVDLKLSVKSGVRTDSNRNFMLKNYLEAGVDYILHLDSDMVYPKDMIVKYLQADKDVIGCVYFRRNPPHEPIVYIDNPDSNNEMYPFISVEPKSMPRDKAVKVDGIGFGGMMVKASVYEKLGDEKWHKYGDNFQIPEELPNKLSHDLVFCKTLKKHNIDIYIHTGVKAGHIAKKIVWDFEPVKKQSEFVSVTDHKLNKKPKIAVLMPSTDVKQAERAISQLQDKAGIEAEYFLLHDKERGGFIKTVNLFTKQNPDYDYYVYTAQDAFAGRDWLKIAVLSLDSTGKGLFAFNDGKWAGALASFGMVSKKYKDKLGGLFFHEGYKSHYADTELTLLAMQDDEFCYSPESLLIEVDWDKKSKGVNLDDKNLYKTRKLNLREPYRSMFS